MPRRPSVAEQSATMAACRRCVRVHSAECKACWAATQAPPDQEPLLLHSPAGASEGQGSVPPTPGVAAGGSAARPRGLGQAAGEAGPCVSWAAALVPWPACETAGFLGVCVGEPFFIVPLTVSSGRLLAGTPRARRDPGLPAPAAAVRLRLPLQGTLPAWAAGLVRTSMLCGQGCWQGQQCFTRWLPSVLLPGALPRRPRPARRGVPGPGPRWQQGRQQARQPPRPQPQPQPGAAAAARPQPDLQPRWGPQRVGPQPQPQPAAAQRAGAEPQRVGAPTAGAQPKPQPHQPPAGAVGAQPKPQPPRAAGAQAGQEAQPQPGAAGRGQGARPGALGQAAAQPQPGAAGRGRGAWLGRAAQQQGTLAARQQEAAAAQPEPQPPRLGRGADLIAPV